MKTITKREFWLGMSIISLCMILSNILYPPILESTLVVKITPIYDVKTKIDNEGNVTVYVNK